MGLFHALLPLALRLVLTYACAEVRMEPLVQSHGKNRRRSPRRTARKSVQVECRKGTLGLGRNLASSALDVSEIGIRLCVTEFLDIREEVEIRISGYGMREVIKRPGFVRWQIKTAQGEFLIGVEFQKPLNYRDLQNLAAPVN
jgi:hypothetical protein